MKSTAKSIGIVMIITVFSRLLSLVSSMVYITYYGISLEMDIYSYAIQLPNIIFTSLGSALAYIVIPIFAGYIGTDQKDRAFKFADNVITISSLFTLILSITGIIVAPAILALTRFRDQGYDFALISVRIMFPVMIFYGLSFIFQGMLQSFGNYNMPALISVPSSLTVILYVYIFGSRFGIKGLLVATFIGLMFQALILVPSIWRAGYRYKPSVQFGNKDVKEALRLAPAVVVSASAYQLNMLFNTTLSANFKDTVSIMTTVQNLVLYAILAFVYSVTSVVFPKLTMMAARNDMEGFKNNLLNVINLIIYFLVPATAGFIAVSRQLFDLLYGWGRVTAGNVSLAGSFLALYALGITGIGIKEVIDRAFYSLKDTKKPAINGVIIMTVNVIASLTLIKLADFFGLPKAFGIPAGYSVSAITGAIVLIRMIKKKIGNFGGKEVTLTYIKIVAASVIMFIAIIPISHMVNSYATGSTVLHKGIRLMVPTVVGALVYFTATYFLKVQQVTNIISGIKGWAKKALINKKN
ncbi:MAG TPA: murein biosynthesis integral membrane protein MurJ [Clostridiaceae bacterium]|nr:murein biosynthesis integral membrane protein MurJ [Clostridiaceae bacterium]